jgi:hypothetical protein
VAGRWGTEARRGAAVAGRRAPMPGRRRRRSVSISVGGNRLLGGRRSFVFARRDRLRRAPRVVAAAPVRWVRGGGGRVRGTARAASVARLVRVRAAADPWFVRARAATVARLTGATSLCTLVCRARRHACSLRRGVGDPGRRCRLLRGGRPLVGCRRRTAARMVADLERSSAYADGDDSGDPKLRDPRQRCAGTDGDTTPTRAAAKEAMKDPKCGGCR